MYKLPLSTYHKTFYYEWKINPSSSNYHIVFDQILSNHLDAEKLRDALNRFVADHLLFNSHVEMVDEELYWIRNEKIEPLNYLPKLSAKKLYRHIATPFDLEKGYLYHFNLIQEKESYRFIIVLHHIIIDGNAFDALLSEISNYYNDPQYRTPISLGKQQELIFQTTSQLDQQLKSNEHQSQLSWRNYLANTEHLDLRFIKLANSEEEGKTPSILSFTLDHITTNRLKSLKEKYGISSYLFGQIVFALLLNRYSSQEKIAISYPIAIKEHQDLIYGAGINTQIVIYTLDEKINFADLIKQAQQWIRKTKTQKLSYYPIHRILEGLDKGVLNICFAQTCLKNTPVQFNNVKVINIKHELNIDLSANIIFESEIKDEKLHFQIRYTEKEFDKNILKNFIKHYKNLLLTFLKDLEKGFDHKPVRQYPILKPKEYQHIVYQWNHTRKEYPENKTIHQLFEEQTLKTPDRIALVYETLQLTYKTLNEKANQLAQYLIKNHNINSKDLIGLYLDRTEHVIIAILAALKTGAAYVPISPGYPEQRIIHILEDTKTSLVLTDQKNKPLLVNITLTKSLSISYLAIDDEKCIKETIKESKQNLQLPTKSTNLAYVMYTSGTTGKPKGIMIEHKSVINTVTSLDNVYINLHNDIPLKIMAFTNYVFDVSVSEFFISLFNGHTLYLLSDAARYDINAIARSINDNAINYIYLPPALLGSLPKIEYKSLYGIIYAGEPCSKKIATAWSKIYALYNYYGPTEATIYATGLRLRAGESHLIGKPIQNTTCYVLDNQLNPVPIGAVGELYIGGDGVARGYLNLPELTTNKFLSNPFQTEFERQMGKNERIYKTGDLVRWDSDGNLEYLGRNDFQVKIRGYRIELSEIETVLNQYPRIKQNTILALPYNNASDSTLDNKYLVAYYVSPQPFDEEKLYNHLAKHLAEYMLPNVFVHLEKFPLTINGKLDKKALPKPIFKNKRDYVPPRTEKEEIICKSFSKVLGKEEIGIHDDFFQLGGHSLKAINLVSDLQTYFKVTVANVFELRTPQQMAQVLFFEKNNLKRRLEDLKIKYLSQPKDIIFNKALEDRKNSYLKSIKKLTSLENKSIKNVLLTGSTGFLGCHLLYQLLHLTDYKIFLPIRSQADKNAFDYINKRFQFYFGTNIETYSQRLEIFIADLESNQLGLPVDIFQSLAKEIDSIIHAAALVKHYGEYEQFYSANVKTTCNLLKLSELTKLKDFHYISTISVLSEGYIRNYDDYIYTEDDFGNDLQGRTNIYCKTKYEGEQAVIESRKNGINANIYRVGNLAFSSKGGYMQENREDNAFYNKIKCLIELGICSEEIGNTEISPVDLTAEAIIKLFDKKVLENTIQHVFNPYSINIANYLEHNSIHPIKILSIEQFIDMLSEYVDKPAYNEILSRFLLHQGWLEELHPYSTNIHLLQNKTQSTLNQLGFTWQPIPKETFYQYLENLRMETKNEKETCNI